jgi:hypothetical protein
LPLFTILLIQRTNRIRHKTTAPMDAAPFPGVRIPTSSMTAKDDEHGCNVGPVETSGLIRPRVGTLAFHPPVFDHHCGTLTFPNDFRPDLEPAGGSPCPGTGL